MRNGTKKNPVVPPSPDFWQLGYDTFRELAFKYRDMGGSAWHVHDYGIWLCNQAAAELVNRLSNVPLSQLQMAFKEALSGMLMCASESEQFVDEDFLEKEMKRCAGH